MSPASAPVPQSLPPTQERLSLRPDCGNCFALCCTALGFSRTADFAVDKPAGTPCLNLSDDFSCSIHDSLRPRGFSGCTVFDCFGAGQTVSQEMFAGKSWRENPGSRTEMFSAFKTVRQLNEMRWHLAEAQLRSLDPDVGDRASQLRSMMEQRVQGELPDLLSLDVQDLHSQVKQLLLEVSEEVRARYFAAGDDHLEPALHPGADLMGGTFRSRQLCGANLRGAYLIAADLRGSDLTGADLLGADLRDARLDGADLSQALFLTQPQVNAARGNSATALPAEISRPGHWHAG